MVLLCNQRTKGAQCSLVPDPLDMQSKEEKAQHQPSCVKDRQPRGLALEQPLAHSWDMDGLLLRAPVQRYSHCGQRRLISFFSPAHPTASP